MYLKGIRFSTAAPDAGNQWSNAFKILRENYSHCVYEIWCVKLRLRVE